MIVPAHGPHREKVFALLGAIGDLTAGDGEAPPSPHEAVPYAILYPYLARYDGPVADIHADLDYMVHIRSVGGTQAQAEDAADRVRAAMLPADLAPAGRVMRGPVTVTSLRPVHRDDDARLASPLWTVDDLYTVPTTPG